MRAVRVALIVVGLLAMGYGLWGALGDDEVAYTGVGLFMAGGLVLHDWLLMPAAILVGVLAGRLLPAWARPPAYLGLFASAVLAFVALPFALGYGRLPDNPSATVRDYWLGLAVTLAVVWLAVGAWLVRRRLRAGTTTPTGSPGPSR